MMNKETLVTFRILISPLVSSNSSYNGLVFNVKLFPIHYMIERRVGDVSRAIELAFSSRML